VPSIGAPRRCVPRGSVGRTTSGNAAGSP